jgi:hypothetical protein
MGHSQEPPRMSQQLRTAWYRKALERMARLQCLASALLYVLHPELFCLARSCYAQLLKSLPQTDIPYARRWGNVFSVIDVLVNRESPLHVDKEPPAGWLDVLFTLGFYKVALFAVPTVGLSFNYAPGTGMILNSSRLLHGASAADGDRACFVFYLRRHVPLWFGLTLAEGSQVAV